MQIIKINPVDDQYISLDLEGIPYRCRIQDRGSVGVYLDVYQGQDTVIASVLCLDRVRIIRSTYLRFPGDLMFVDQNGFENPTYLGFGTRFLLYHLNDDELNVGL